MKKLTLYHGSNQSFDAVDLGKSRNKRDFGCGFYMTTLKGQAEQWAENMYARYAGDGQYVYEFELTLIEDIIVKRFEGLTVEWLSMIKENRINGGLQHDFDIVWGPVADDNTMRTIALFIEGIYTVEMALERLKYFKANDQVSIHTEKALSYLKLMERVSYEK